MDISATRLSPWRPYRLSAPPSRMVKYYRLPRLFIRAQSKAQALNNVNPKMLRKKPLLTDPFQFVQSRGNGKYEG